MKPSVFINRLIQRAVIAVALFFIGLHSPVSAQTIHKGIWILREDMASRERIDRFLRDAQEMGFSDLFVQVRGRGDAMYQSKYVEVSPMIREAGFDPLKYVCDEGHKAGLKIHAWFNTYVLYSNHSETPPDFHVLSLFPEWMEWDENGIHDGDKLKGNQRGNNFEGIYLSPTHPQVNRYLLVLMKELISEYTIDGLHLDYVRYQGPHFGFNPEGMDAFYDKYGVNPRLFLKEGPLWSDSHSYTLFRKLYDQYRREAINNLIRGLAAYNQSLNIPVQISAAVKPSPLEAKNDFFQDWAEWLKEGWLDIAIPMNYSTRISLYRKNLEDIRSVIPPEYQEKIWIGNGIWNQPYASFKEKTSLARSLNFPHYVIFSYNVLKADKKYFENMKTFNLKEGR